MLNKWGTVAFERDLIRRILTDDPYRGVEKWLRMVPPAYRADVAVWVQSSFNAKWAKRLATQDTMHALVADLVCFIEGIEPRDPIPDDGSPWIADPPPWELRPEEHQRRMMDILAAGPIRPGYQHSPATYVEGREAPRREGCCEDGERVIRDYEGRRVIVTGLSGPDRVPAMLRADDDMPAHCSITTVFFCPWCGASSPTAAKRAGKVPR